jgi:1-acyl-sn-glycerol-3-phosphate acyltransferase
MKLVPPKLVRRLVLAPIVVLADLLVLVLSPILLLAALLASPFTGGLRPLRALAIVLAFAGYHLAAMLACLGLWVASGFGWKTRSEPMVRAHYVVMRWFVNGVYRVIVRVARVRVEMTPDSTAADDALATHGKPVLVLARHAGEGDTLLVIHALLCRHGRGPRVVMHEALRLDPLIDVLGERLPNRFLDPRGGDTEKEIAAMAEELGDTAALVIFPEGANFTEERRRRGIERLESGGFAQQAEAARGMRHVSAPRPGGALAAIAAAPHSDVVVLGHAGFPTGVRELWRLLPHEQTVELRLWLEPAAAVPSERDAQIEWLFGQWQRLDAWVEERTRENGEVATATTKEHA